MRSLTGRPSFSLPSSFQAAVAAGVGGAEFWGASAAYYGLAGEPLSRREALLKQVRALQGQSRWRESADPAAFAALAAALRGVAEASLGLAGPGGAITRPDLLSLRLQLKAVLKQGAERYGEGEAHAELAECADRLGAAAAALAP